MKTLAQIEPRTPISSVPFIITNAGSYYLTTNLTGTNGVTGITISSGQATLDLSGFTLQGTTGSSDGIYVSATYTNLIVRNGTINGWGGAGVDDYDAGYPRNAVFENLTVSGNRNLGLIVEAGTEVRDCLVINNANGGIFSAGGLILRCVTRNNAGYGFYGFYCTVSDSEAEYNAGDGFDLANGSAKDCQSQFNTDYGFSLVQSRLINCQSDNNFTGVLAETSGSEVRDCSVEDNSEDGIDLEESSIATGNYVAGNGEFGLNVTGSYCQILGNNCVSNGYTGIWLQSCTGNRIDNNNVSASGDYGIFLNLTTTNNNVITRNHVGANPAANYNIPTGNDVGPIGTAATSTSPWANFSH